MIRSYCLKDRIYTILFLGFLGVGCQPTQLPNNVELSLSPTEKSIVISSDFGHEGVECLGSEYPYIDVPFVFALRDAQGSSIGGIPVSFYADWTGQSSGAESGVQLMFDFNGDGVADAATETVSGIGEGVFERKTSEFGGEVQLTLRLNLSCPYQGELVAFVGGYHSSADFIVQLESVPEPEPEPLDDPTVEDEK